MANTPSRGIPYVPQGTLDPAAGLNLSLNVIDALLQTAVESMSLSSPPGGAVSGETYIVASGASGAWAGQENNLAQYTADDEWDFYEAGVSVVIVLNLADGQLYRYSASLTSWVPLASSPVVNTSSALVTATPETAGRYTRFSHASPSYHFSDSESYVIGAEYRGRYAGSGSLMITSDTGFVINAPAGGTHEILPDGTFTIKIVAADEADLSGDTV